MKRLTEEWNESYSGPGPGPGRWDSGVTSLDLRKAIETGRIRPCRALELGCGAGTNAIYISQHGFDVTAVDVATLALERARKKAKKEGVTLRFVHASVLHLPPLGEPFHFVFDRGCWHTLDDKDRPAYLRELLKATRPGASFLLICGSAKGRWPDTQGPPKVRKREIIANFRRDFEILSITDTRFEEPEGAQAGLLAYAAWMLRKGPPAPNLPEGAPVF